MSALTVPELHSLPPGHPDEFLGLAISPAEQVRRLLSRKKQQGISDWSRVWPWAVGRVRWPHDREERHEWKATIAWSEPIYRRAYEGGECLDMSLFDLPQAV